MELNKSGLGKEYRDSLTLLNKRISDLQQKRKALMNDPYSGSMATIKSRLLPLILMQRELKEVAIEVEEYYTPGHYRNSKITMNKREPKIEKYAPLYYDM